MVKIDSVPQLSYMPKGEDRQGKGVLCHLSIILLYYPYTDIIRLWSIGEVLCL